MEGLFLGNFFHSVDSGNAEYAAFQVVTMGPRDSAINQHGR